MSDEDIVRGLGEAAKSARTPYEFDAIRQGAARIVELNRDLEFARKQNQMLGATINENARMQ